MNEPNLTNNRLMYHHPDALNTAVKEWTEHKTGIMANVPGGCVCLARIDKTIRDPVWDTAKAEKQRENASNCDPTGQLTNQIAY